MCMFLARCLAWVESRFIDRPLWMLFRDGPRLIHGVPMYGGMSDAELCHTISPNVPEQVWRQVPAECGLIISKQFASWKTFLLICVYFYFVHSVWALLPQLCSKLVASSFRPRPKPEILFLVNEENDLNARSGIDRKSVV